MAKTHKNLYPQVYGYAALITAWRKARRGKRYKPAAAAFEQNLDAEFTMLVHQLRTTLSCPKIR